jgi:hypothetical protein
MTSAWYNSMEEFHMAIHGANNYIDLMRTVVDFTFDFIDEIISMGGIRRFFNPHQNILHDLGAVVDILPGKGQAVPHVIGMPPDKLDSFICFRISWVQACIRFDLAIGPAQMWEEIDPAARVQCKATHLLDFPIQALYRDVWHWPRTRRSPNAFTWPLHPHLYDGGWTGVINISHVLRMRDPDYCEAVVDDPDNPGLCILLLSSRNPRPGPILVTSEFSRGFALRIYAVWDDAVAPAQPAPGMQCAGLFLRPTRIRYGQLRAYVDTQSLMHVISDTGEKAVIVDDGIISPRDGSLGCPATALTLKRSHTLNATPPHFSTISLETLQAYPVDYVGTGHFYVVSPSILRDRDGFIARVYTGKALASLRLEPGEWVDITPVHIVEVCSRKVLYLHAKATVTAGPRSPMTVIRPYQRSRRGRYETPGQYPLTDVMSQAVRHHGVCRTKLLVVAMAVSIEFRPVGPARLSLVSQCGHLVVNFPLIFQLISGLMALGSRPFVGTPHDIQDYVTRATNQRWMCVKLMCYCADGVLANCEVWKIKECWESLEVDAKRFRAGIDAANLPPPMWAP